MLFRSAANEIVRSLSGLYVTPTEEFSGGRVQLRSFPVDKSSLVGKAVSGINFRRPCLPVLVLRDDEVKIPGRDYVIRQGDHVYVLASSDDMDAVGAAFDQPGAPTKTVVIFGGGNVGLQVAQQLEKRGMQLKLIEKSAERCQELSNQLKQTTVVQAGRPDRELLADEGVASADAFIASTGDEALNIVAGVVAKNLGVERIIVLVDRPGYMGLAQSVGLDVAISPVLQAGNKVSRYVLRGGAVGVALLGDEQAEGIEYVVSSGAGITKEGGARVPQGAIMGAIVRGNEVILPPGDTRVEPGDRVIMVSELSSVPKVEKLFR